MTKAKLRAIMRAADDALEEWIDTHTGNGENITPQQAHDALWITSPMYRRVMSGPMMDCRPTCTWWLLHNRADVS